MSAARPHQLRYWEQPIPEEEEHEKREEGSSARQKQQRKDENKQFRCHVCKLQVKYSFYGRRPANCSVVFLEPAFLVFEGPRHLCTPLCLGAECSLCNEQVCVECSVFYTQRFCFACLAIDRKDVHSQLPQQALKEFRRWLAKPTSSSFTDMARHQAEQRDGQHETLVPVLSHSSVDRHVGADERSCTVALSLGASQSENTSQNMAPSGSGTTSHPAEADLRVKAMASIKQINKRAKLERDTSGAKSHDKDGSARKRSKGETRM